jgi:NitT/TauT family transport system ATP-binding protein
MSLLAIENVSKTFNAKRGGTVQGTLALTDVSFTVEDGEFLVIIGSSGCGKSTLLRLIDGLIAPSEGRVTIHGQEVTGPGPDRGVVFQQANLLAWRTVRGNIEFGLECLGVDKAERRRRATRYIDMVGLTGFEDHYPAQLSGGMQQRVGLARAFAVEPEILLMDEPFGALDAQTRLILQSELEHIWSANRRTAILITHDMEEALFLADRIVVMSSHPGRVSSIIEVPFARPRDDEIRADPRFAEMKATLWEALKAGMAQHAG